jgi:hypothetical protein
MAVLADVLKELSTNSKVFYPRLELLHSRLGARWSDVDVMKSLKAGGGDGECL